MSLKNIEDVCRLSPAQEALFLQEQQATERRGNCGHMTLLLSGHLDRPQFDRAWQEVTLRHSILRTFFVWKRLEKPAQVVQRQVVLPIAHHDWRELSSSAKDESLKALSN